MTENDRHDESGHRRDVDPFDSAREAPSDADRAWVERLREAYGPEPLTAERRAEFDRRLYARLPSERRWFPVLAPALAMAAALVAVWFVDRGLLPFTNDEVSREQGSASNVRLSNAEVEWIGAALEEDAPLSTYAWADGLFERPADFDSRYADDRDVLPDDYAMLASLMF